jgi:ribosomal protein S12 methylthiotransferase
MLRDSRILPYFDLPFQHASERLLRAMNRRGEAQGYLELIETIRNRLPECMIRSTFLVGFPGETDEDFRLLRDFQDRARLDWLGTFAYSREEGTVAHSMKGRVSRKTAENRRRMIEEAQVGITSAKLARFIGSCVDVIIEERIESENLCIGRAWMQSPEVDGLTVVRGTHEPGSLVHCRIVALNGVDFEAIPIGYAGAAFSPGESEAGKRTESDASFTADIAKRPDRIRKHIDA